ncbi:hypothetical protein [Dyadobacter sp. BHUBP1]|uniref:hypothetical protein n=1 Tax=Dyadobacter sp. BHUBP1 TaxID=3424178 RepID=UPI003D34BE55
MKSILTTIIYIVLVPALFAQNTTTLYYQGIARNAQGAPLAGVTIAVRLSIKDALSNGNSLYSETKSVTTNAFGLYSISINDGSGARTGDFNAINWSSPRFLQTEIDPANGAAFVDMGTQQMQSVPHSLSAKSLDGVANPKNGDLLEYKDGSWRAKPKVKIYRNSGLGNSPSANLNFIGPTVTVTFDQNNPNLTLFFTKALGSTAPGGASLLNLNLGYRQAGQPVAEFVAAERMQALSTAINTRMPVTLTGNYDTAFEAGGTYEIGIVGFSPNAAHWNNSDLGKGIVEVRYP